jgi:SAM-dependent MidA family methyltransferase
MERDIKVYQTMSYTILEISLLTKRQIGLSRHQLKVDIRLQNVFTLDKSSKECIVLALEVLDNLPHDKKNRVEETSIAATS